jgi:hypothetical protein
MGAMRLTSHRNPVLVRTCPVPLSCPDKGRAGQVQGTGQVPTFAIIDINVFRLHTF